MSNINPKTAKPVKWMLWVARFLSIPWAFWALFWMFFILHNYLEEGFFSLTVFIIIMVIILLMFLGAAIMASVWGKEAFGGGVLLLDGVLVIGIGILGPHSPFLIEGEFWNSVVIISTCVLPPLIAGSMFLAYNQKLKTSGEKHI
jgi:hypothetical protein